MGRMVVVVAAVLLLCGTGCEEDEHFPPGEGGGPGGGGGGQVDAGDEDAGDEDAGEDQLRGRLCDVADVREPIPADADDCSARAGIDVAVLDSNASDETDADGNFSLDVEFDSSLDLAIDDDEDETRRALVRVDNWDEGGLRVPRVAQEIWDDLILSLSIQDTDGTAALLLYVEDAGDGQPVVGAVVSAIGDAIIHYDDDEDAEGWSLGDGTGPSGAALLVQVPAEQEVITVTVNAEDFDIPVQPDRLTWAKVSLP
jgi:hypothetical protein